jgi:hypothetical protein
MSSRRWTQPSWISSKRPLQVIGPSSHAPVHTKAALFIIVRECGWSSEYNADKSQCSVLLPRQLADPLLYAHFPCTQMEAASLYCMWRSTYNKC